jgi:hypothetical protein
MRKMVALLLKVYIKQARYLFHKDPIKLIIDVTDHLNGKNS